MPGPSTLGGRRGPQHLELLLAPGTGRGATVTAVVVVVLALLGSLGLACGVGFLLAEPPAPPAVRNLPTGPMTVARPRTPELSEAG